MPRRERLSGQGNQAVGVRAKTMSRSVGRFCWAKGIVLALCVLGLAPTAVEAASLGYRNDLNVPIVIQTVVVVNNQLRKGKPLILLPGEVSLDPVTPMGARRIIINGARRPNPLLFQDDITVKDDVFYSVQFDAKTGKVKLMPTELPKQLKKQDPPKK
jgi:hypothetical protein